MRTKYPGTTKEKRAAAMKVYWEIHPRDTVKNGCGSLESKRRYSLGKLYGITPEQWEEIFETQGSACGVCGATEPRGGRWHTDHCHDTGKVRGILCFKCN